MAVQSETLNDFINRRMKTLQIGYKGMTNAGVGAWTFKKIREDPTRLSEAEFQKIAYALRCSIGDLKACLPNSIRKGTGHDMDLLAKEIGEPSVMKTVAKLEQMVEQEYPELRDAADYGTDPQNSGTVPEEIVEKSFENETISDDTPNDPAEPVTKALDFNCIENAKPKRKTKKNSSDRYKRYQTRCGRTEAPDGRRIQTAAERYVFTKVPALRKQCTCGYSSDRHWSSAG